MISLAFVAFSIFGFLTAYFHYSKKNQTLRADELTTISGKISRLEVSSFGRNANITLQFSEYQNRIFLTDKHGYIATAKADLEKNVHIGEMVFLSVAKDEKIRFDVQNFYELKTTPLTYLSLENYNRAFEKYQAGNFRLGIFGGIFCLLFAIGFLIL